MTAVGDGEGGASLVSMAGICQMRPFQSIVGKLRVTSRVEHSQGHPAGPVVSFPQVRTSRQAGGVRGTLSTCTATGDSEPQIQAVLADSKVPVRNLSAEARNDVDEARYATHTF